MYKFLIIRYFYALKFIEINFLHSFPVLSELPPVKDGIETLKATLHQSQEHAKEQVKGFTSKTRQTIQDKVTKHSVIACYLN